MKNERLIKLSNSEMFRMRACLSARKEFLETLVFEIIFPFSRTRALFFVFCLGNQQCPGSDGKASVRRRLGFDPWVGKIPPEKEMATHSQYPRLGNATERGA